AAEQGVAQADESLVQLRQAASGRSRRTPAERQAVEQAFGEYRARLWKDYPGLTREGDEPLGAALLRQGRTGEAVAILIRAAASLVGGASVTALDWSVYDRWLRSRAPVADTPRLVIVARDPSSEARFGAGAWDRTMLARVVAALGRGGAAVVGLDVPLGTPSAPGRGGAASDALLAQAAQTVDVVAVVSSATPRVGPAAPREPNVRHTAAEP